MHNARLGQPLKYSAIRGDTHPELARSDEYHLAGHKASVSVEEAALLYGLALALKPLRILETGSGPGFATIHLALACRDAGIGMVTSVDIDPERVAETRHRLEALGLEHHATVIQGSGIWAIHDARTHGVSYGMALLDSAIESRPEELRSLAEILDLGAVVAIHDTSPEHPVEIMQPLPGGSRIDLPTPRGLTLWQRDEQR